MINLDNYYLHATAGALGKTAVNQSIIGILKDREIRTKEDRGYTAIKYSRDNELCFFDPSIKRTGIKKLFYYSALELYAYHGPCLVINKTFDTYRPKLVTIYKKETETNIIGTTNIYDEVRYKGNISLDNLEYITFPLYTPKDFKENNIVPIEHLEEFLKTMKVLEQNFPNVLVKDLFTGSIITSEEVDKKIDDLNQKRMIKFLSKGVKL